MFWSNFIHFDWLIFALACLEIFIFFKCKKNAAKLRSKLTPSAWLPAGESARNEINRHFKRFLSSAGEKEILDLESKVNFQAGMYENIAGVFPLLGILGTVVSLIPMVNAVGSETVNLFFGALTSTFWGIVFAIIFRSLSGYLFSLVDDCERDVEIYISRNSARIVSNAADSVLAEKQQRRDEKGDKALNSGTRAGKSK